DGGPGQVRKAGGLKVGEIAEERTGGTDRGVVSRLEPQSVERRQRKAAAQLLARQRRVELPAFPLRTEGAIQLTRRFVNVEPIGRHDLRGREARQRFGESRGIE